MPYMTRAFASELAGFTFSFGKAYFGLAKCADA